MRAKDRALARRQLDKRLNLLSKPDVLARPPRGWVKAIRDALGMTAEQLGARIGVSQVRALALEKAEASGRITLASLDRARRRWTAGWSTPWSTASHSMSWWKSGRRN
jgi:transcriptional regulator with XRE-family HTH domain